jgi:hypothetical protein
LLGIVTLTRKELHKSVQIEDELRRKIGIESPARSKNLVEEHIEQLKLDLSELVVLTEAASGNYIYTPLIAAVAKARKVLAFTRDSRYGKAKDVTENTYLLARYFGIEKKRIQIFESLSPQMISKADVVTNLGFVRPIDKDFISNLKPTAVISLMYETWEFREEDLDLRECWRKGIPVLGTNEQHDVLRIFDYIGPLCLKILLEAEIEVFRSKVVLVGNNDFGRNIVGTLSAADAQVSWVTNTSADDVKNLGGTKIGCSLKEPSVQIGLRDCDAVIVNTYPDKEVAIGKGGDISAKRLKELAPGTTVIQLNGSIERDSLDKLDIACLPREEPAANHMGWTLGYLGPRPVVGLNSGGLKVGELLGRARMKEPSRVEAEREALKNHICQDFSPSQHKKYGS